MLIYLTCAAFLVQASLSIEQVTTSVRFNHGTRTEVLYSTIGSSTGASRISGFKDNDDSDISLGGLFAVHKSAIGGGQCSEVVINRGVERIEAMLYAIDAINSDPNLLPNITLGYDIRDTCMSFNLALDETADLLLFGKQIEIGSCTANNITDSLLAGVIGASASYVSRPVASLLRVFQIPQVSYSSSSPLLSNRDRYSYFFRTIPSDNEQARAIFDLILYFNWDHISLIYSNNDYGEPIGQLIQRFSQVSSICIDLNEPIDVDFQTSDFNKLAHKINNSTANVIVLFASFNDVANLLKEIDNVQKNDGGRSNFILIGGDSWVGNQNITAEYPNITAGFWGTAPFTIPYLPFDDYLFNLTQNTNHRNPWFDDNYFSHYFNCTLTSCTDISMRASDDYTQDPVIPLVIDAVYSIVHALQNFFNDNCQQPFEWNPIDNTCQGQNMSLNGENLLPYIQNISFLSITGNQVAFDSFGSVAAKYRVYNYQVRAMGSCNNCTVNQLVEVGVWDGSLSQNQLSLNSNISKQFGVNHTTGEILMALESNCQNCRPGYFKRLVTSSCCGTCDPCLGSNYTNTNSSTMCMTCPDNMWGNNPLTGNTHCIDIDESYLKPSDAWGIVLIILAIIGLIAVVFVTYVFIWYWNTPIVKSSGREQMIMLLIGLTLCFFITIFFLLKPSPAACGLQRIGIWVSYSLILCSLLVKLIRIARIFMQKTVSSRPRFIAPQYQIGFTLILMCFPVLIVIISLIVAPPEANRAVQYNEVNHNSHPELIVTCSSPHIAFIVLQMVYFSGLLIASNALAVMTIRFPINFNEAKYVAFATFSLVLTWFFFILAFIVSQNTPYQGAALSTTIQVSAVAVLLCLFGPKMFIMIAWPTTNIKENTTASTTIRRSTHNSAAVMLSTINNNDYAKTINEEQ